MQCEEHLSVSHQTWHALNACGPLSTLRMLLWGSVSQGNNMATSQKMTHLTYGSQDLCM